ncbi:hypothetical protein E1212_16295 [Jiangella ureilytica]|uniref:Uncharacterized protein n=1 Tax=Jiangella ureilytica TaxID=2530374 RepID=A0A4R4RKR3_9ACTN|nr:hypothetical protein E1212_16295 [Jiangella ureilytica]
MKGHVLDLGGDQVGKHRLTMRRLMLREAGHDATAVADSPVSHGKKIWSTTPLERMSKASRATCYGTAHDEPPVSLRASRGGSISVAVEAVAVGGLSAGRWDGCGAGEHREHRLGVVSWIQVWPATWRAGIVGARRPSWSEQHLRL